MPTTLFKNPISLNVAASDVGLDVAGTPAVATVAAGAKPANTLTVNGTAGQATTGSGQSAGAGADVWIAGGAGGAAPAGSTNGKGGSVTINPGAPGGGAGTAGTYGNVLVATSGGNLGIGTSAPTASVEISGTGRTFTSTRIAAGSAGATFTVRKATTGMTAVANGHEIANFTYSGFDGTAYIGGARIRIVVDAAVSAGNVPTAMTFSTGNGGFFVGGAGAAGEAGPEEEECDAAGLGAFVDNAINERLRITSAGNVGINTPVPTSKLHVNGGVQVGFPTGGDMGSGAINVSGDIYKNGAAYTNPDYVFEHHFAGATHAGYAGPVPLAQLEDAIRTHGQLPGIGRAPMGVFGRQDALLEKLEEAYLYIIELTRRVDRLEAERAPASGKETV
jgi:hypothetical protein